jgi:hypothetical protein
MSEQRVRLPLRIPVKLKVKLAELAEQEHRSLNKQIEFMLEESIGEVNKDKARESVRTSAEHKRK